jgi:hypothetical protein
LSFISRGPSDLPSPTIGREQTDTTNLKQIINIVRILSRKDITTLHEQLKLGIYVLSNTFPIVYTLTVSLSARQVSPSPQYSNSPERRKGLDVSLLGAARCGLASSLPAAINRPPDILPAGRNCEGFIRKEPSISASRMRVFGANGISSCIPQCTTDTRALRLECTSPNRLLHLGHRTTACVTLSSESCRDVRPSLIDQ